MILRSMSIGAVASLLLGLAASGAAQLPAQTSNRPQAYTIISVSSMPPVSNKSYRNGANTKLNQPILFAVWPMGSTGSKVASWEGAVAAPAAAALAPPSRPPAPPPTSVSGQVATYGDKDLVGFSYPQGVDPTAGVQLTGLAAGAVSVSSQIFKHGIHFKAGDNDSPGGQEYPNTDQIFVGSNQTAQEDGYSGDDTRMKGPATFRLDYSQLVRAGQRVTSLTLGIAADDFQFPSFHQPFSAAVNGQPDKAITDQLESLDETGPQTYFFTVGIDPSILRPDHVLTLWIDEGGDGGDGFAVDFLTVGVGTSSTPAAAATPAAPPSPPVASAPVEVEIPAGPVIIVRMIDLIDSRHNKPGEEFSATVDSDVVVNGNVIFPKDSPARVRLVNASQSGYFFGRSTLELRLVSVTVNGNSYATESGDYGLHGASRTKQTVERVGGGAAIGGLFGGIMGGRKGAAIGAGVGAGAGVGVQAVTRGKSVRIPSETKLDFTLSSAATVGAAPAAAAAAASPSTPPPTAAPAEAPATATSTPSGPINVSTGLDASDKLITTGGVADAHWTVQQEDGTTGPAQVLGDGSSNWFNNWTTDGKNLSWIGRTSDKSDNGPAPYTFSITFNVPASDLSTAQLSGSWAIDDAGTLSLNGRQIAELKPCKGCGQSENWDMLNNFSVPAGSPCFLQGTNTLSITITYSDDFNEGVRLEGSVTGVGTE
ncbi:MAG: hypothetical protein ACYDD2_02105 [Candidatus Acidiferrales bacterium]